MKQKPGSSWLTSVWVTFRYLLRSISWESLKSNQLCLVSIMHSAEIKTCCLPKSYTAMATKWPCFQNPAKVALQTLTILINLKKMIIWKSLPFSLMILIRCAICYKPVILPWLVKIHNFILRRAKDYGTSLLFDIFLKISRKALPWNKFKANQITSTTWFFSFICRSLDYAVLSCQALYLIFRLSRSVLM